MYELHVPFQHNVDRHGKSKAAKASVMDQILPTRVRPTHYYHHSGPCFQRSQKSQARSISISSAETLQSRDNFACCSHINKRFHGQWIKNRTIESIRSALHETARGGVTLDLEEIVDSANARNVVKGAIGLLCYCTVQTGQVAGRDVAEALSVSWCCEHGCDGYELGLHHVERRPRRNGRSWRDHSMSHVIRVPTPHR